MNAISRRPAAKPCTSVFRYLGPLKTFAPRRAGFGRIAGFRTTQNAVRCSAKQDNKGFNFQKKGQNFRISVNETELVIPEQVLMGSGLALLGLAFVIGPLVIGLTVTALSIGFTLSIGAFAISTMFLPLAIFMLISLMTFGGVFGSFALLGLGVFLPQMLSLVVAGAGLAIGWAAVRMFTPPAAGKKSELNNASSKAKSKTQQELLKEEQARFINYEEEAQDRMSEELRDFDTMLAERDHQKRVSQWKQVDKQKR